MTSTIREVAKQAGVSIATVSTVVNNKSSRYGITPETERKVRETVKKLKYRPSSSGRNLRNGKFDAVGVLMFESESISSELYGKWLGTFTSCLHDKDLNTMLLLSSLSEPTIPKMIRERHVDGVVLVEHIPDVIYQQLCEMKLPFINVNASPYKEYDCIYPDDYNGMKDAVEYLVGLGHRKILYMDVKRTKYQHLSNKLRLEAYVDSLRNAGLSVPEQVFSPPEDEVSDAMNWLENIFRENQVQWPTAIISYWENWWNPVATIAAKYNISIPKDLSYITFNNLDVTSKGYPLLTCVDVGIREMALKASQFLYKKIYENEKQLPSAVLSEKLIIRDSTAAVKERH